MCACTTDIGNLSSRYFGNFRWIQCEHIHRLWYYLNVYRHSYGNDWSLFIEMFVYKISPRFSLKSTSLTYWAYYSTSKCLPLIEDSWLLRRIRNNFSSISAAHKSSLKGKDKQENRWTLRQMRELQGRNQKCSSKTFSDHCYFCFSSCYVILCWNIFLLASVSVAITLSLIYNFNFWPPLPIHSNPYVTCF